MFIDYSHQETNDSILYTHITIFIIYIYLSFNANIQCIENCTPIINIEANVIERKYRIRISRERSRKEEKHSQDSTQNWIVIVACTKLLKDEMAPKMKGKTQRSIDEEQQLKRERIFREIKLSTLNMERYRSFWSEMMTRIKLPDIVRNVEVAWQTLQHAFDLKDYNVSLLLDSLHDAEKQRQKANSAHVEVIERSLQTHQARLEIVDTLFYGDMEKALANRTYEFENISYYRNKGESALRKINLFVNNRSENTSSIARSTAFSKIDTFVEDGKNERRIITTQLQKKLENLWSDLRNVFVDYRKSTEDRRKAYETIRKKDEIDQQTIIRQYLRTTVLLEEIAKFREKINSYTNESATELQEITQESNYFHSIYGETNERFISGRKADKYKTMTMSKEYNRSVQNLKRLLIKAERILTYMQMCRKYETQDEKILPSIDTHPMQFSHVENDVFSLKTAARDFQNSINFWRRLGLAQLIAEELNIERNQLLIQASDLRETVTCCFADGTTPMCKTLTDQ